MSDITKLQAVAESVIRRNSRKAEAELAAEAWVEKQVAEAHADVERAVMEALRDGWKVTDVARAYTVSGKTPDRNSIHRIKKKNESLEDSWSGEYPFTWDPRTIRTQRGERTVYDVVGTLNNFGPDEVSGTFTWLFDVPTGELEPVLTDEEPYPTTKFYKQVLKRWLVTHPYPGAD